MVEDVDYKAIAEQLQKELEQARLKILELRNNFSFWGWFNLESIRNFIQENYLVLLVACSIISVVWSFIKPLITKRLHKDTKE